MAVSDRWILDRPESHRAVVAGTVTDGTGRLRRASRGSTAVVSDVTQASLLPSQCVLGAEGA